MNQIQADWQTPFMSALPSTTVACFSAFFGVRWQRWTGGGDAIWTIE
jgi:hypothetical protein